MQIFLSTKFSYLALTTGLLVCNTIAADTLPKANFKGQSPASVIDKVHSANPHKHG